MNLPNQKNCSQTSLRNKLEEFLSQGRTKFYLRDITEEASVRLIDSEDFFIPLLKENELEGSLEVRCPNCSAELGIFKEYPQIPKELHCELCETEFSRSSDYVEIVLEVTEKFFRAQSNSFTTSYQKDDQERTKRVPKRCRRRTKWC